MSFVVRTSRDLTASADVAFDRLADFSSWNDWMPDSFRPYGDANGSLSIGRKIQVLIDGLSGPAKLEVSRFQRPIEIAWRGGLPGMLWAEHRFVFEENEHGGVRVSSIETWSGFLTIFLKRFLERTSLRVGGEQLEALSRAASGATSKFVTTEAGSSR